MLKTFIKHILFILIYQNLYAQNELSLLNKNIIINKEEATIAEYFFLISSQGITLSYNNAQIDVNTSATIKKGSYQAAQLLYLLLGDNIKLKVYKHKIIISKPSFEEQLFTLNGFVYAGNGKEAVPLASVKVLGANVTVFCNDYGYYSVRLPAKKNILQVSSLGYATKIDTINLQKSLSHNFYLDQGINLPPLEIKNDKNLFFNEFTRIDTNSIKNLPFLLGEVDPMRVIGLKAGVTTDGLHVRGGTADQNLILLDGAPIYNYSHFTGILSVFNNDIIKRIDFYKGGFPARYEGRLSSVIDVKTKDGDMQSYDGVINIGLLNGSMKLEGPIIKDKLSFLTSFRRSWIDGLIRLLLGKNFPFNYYLYDANIKLNYISDSNSRIYLSIYAGMDKLNYHLFDDNLSTLQWTNKTASLRWNKVYGSGAFHNTTFMISCFKNQFNDQSTPSLDQLNQIDNFGFENNFSHYWSNNFVSLTGLGVNYTLFKSLDETQNGLLKKQNSLQLKAYSDNNIDLNRFNLKYGLQHATFIIPGKTYHSFQPRISLVYQVDNLNRFFGQFAYVVQFYHQITSNIGATPSQFRSPSTATLPPEKSLNYDLGYSYFFKKKGKITGQFFYKKYDDILIYKPQYGSETSLIVTENWRGVLLSGKGVSKGIEFEFLKQFNRFNIQSSYTLSKSELSFAEVNNGTPFLSPYDLTNQFRLLLSIALSKKWYFSNLFSYSTGGNFCAARLPYKPKRG